MRNQAASTTSFPRHDRWSPMTLLAALGCLALTLSACATTAVTARAPAASTHGPDSQGLAFNDWVRAFRGYALAQGISAATFDMAFANVSYNPRVAEANQNQPEFSRPVWDYLDRAVSDERIARGKAKHAENTAALRAAEQSYGVPTSIVTAIWGLESGYGANLGSKNIIEALATLAYQGNRRAFGREQLLAALRILESKDIPPQRLVGSWAGAMGHTQFIPTTFLGYAVDADGDGRRNLWDSLPDVFASTANYLDKKGWQKGRPCFTEVRLPQGFDYAQADIDVSQTVTTWTARGVRRMDGRSLDTAGVETSAQAAILVPAGHKGPAFAVYENFRAVLKYNQSQSYALAICQLANRIEGRGEFIAAWPKADPPLQALSERQELQRLLARKDPGIGEPDGIIGRRTRAAIRAFQASNNLIPDGYPTQSLLALMRTKAQ